MPEEQQRNKSTRSFEEWKEALLKTIVRYKDRSGNENLIATIVDEKVKPYYDQGLMPDVCFKELFNR